MSDFESMRAKHRKDSMLTLSFFVFFILIYVFHTQYISAFHNLLKDPSTLSDVLKESWFTVILTLVSPFVSYFLGIFTIANRDFYYDIDNHTLKTRKEVDSFICKNMLDLKSTLTENDKNKLTLLKKQVDTDEISRKIMRIFYYFIEKEETVNPQLKSHAFIYWGDYFTSLMFAFWGILAIAVTIAIDLFDKSTSPLRLFILLIFVLSISLNLYSILKGKTRKRLFSVPTTQIEEIHRNASGELLETLRKENFFQS